MLIKVEPGKQIHSHQALLTEFRTESLKKNIKQLGGCATNKSMKLHVKHCGYQARENFYLQEKCNHRIK